MEALALSPRHLATAIERSRHVNYLNMASLAVMVSDWLFTFDLEVSLVWKAEWTAGTVLYLLARYLTFVDVALVMYHQLGFALSKTTCERVYDIVAWEYVIGSAIVEFVLTLRTIGVWSKGKRFTYALSMAFAAMCIAISVTFGLYITSLGHRASSAPRLIGCTLVPKGPSKYMNSVGFVLLMIYDGYLLILMVTRYIEDFKSGGPDSHFMRAVYADAIMYYVYIFALALLNALVIIKLPGDYQTLLLLLQRVMHSVLACRVVLHIRHQVAIDASWRGGFEVRSSIAPANEIEPYLSGDDPAAERWERSSVHQ